MKSALRTLEKAPLQHVLDLFKEPMTTDKIIVVKALFVFCQIFEVKLALLTRLATGCRLCTKAPLLSDVGSSSTPPFV